MARVQKIITGNPHDNLSYLIHFSESKVLILDPFYSGQIITLLESQNLIPIALVNTHEHFDHIAANNELAEFFNIPVYAPHNAVGIPNQTHELKEGDIIELDEHSHIEILETPGHTFSHICLKLIQDGEVTDIITGDTMFNFGVGNCRSGDAELLYHSITSHFLHLPPSTRVHCGHDYVLKNLDFAFKVNPEDKKKIDEVRTIYLKDKENLVSIMKLEYDVNPFLRTKDKVEFLTLRKLRDSF